MKHICKHNTTVNGQMFKIALPIEIDLKKTFCITIMLHTSKQANLRCSRCIHIRAVMHTCVSFRDCVLRIEKVIVSQSPCKNSIIIGVVILLRFLVIPLRGNKCKL